MYDGKTIEKSIDNMRNLGNLPHKNMKLIGDKGYCHTAIDRKKIIDTYGIELLYPHKKTQKIKTSETAKKLLKNRYVIEHVFNTLKTFGRLCMRQDRLISTFRGFIYLAIIIKSKFLK